MVVAHKETPLVLKVEMGRESIGRYLFDNLLLKFLKIYLPSFIQFFGMMYRKIKDSGKYSCRCGTGGIHISFAKSTYMICIFLDFIQHGKQASAQVAFIIAKTKRTTF